MRTAPLAFILAIAILWALACTEEENPGRGGIRTAQLRGESFVADGKLAECTGGFDLPTLWKRVFDSPDSLPVTDGWDAKWFIETSGVLGDMLSAKDCPALYKALNYGVEPLACTKEDKACSGDVAQECREVGGSMLRFDTDCTRAGMTCSGGECVLGACTSDSCDGDSLVRCDAQRRKQPFLCGVLGLTCGNGGDGLQCVGKGDICTTSDPDNPVLPKCSNAILSWCLGGHMASVDCSTITDGRRACNQAWLDAHIDMKPEDILDKHLADACGPTGTECVGSTSDCDGSYLKLCIDGFYEWEPCRDYRTTGCDTAGVFDSYASCKGFPAAQ